MHPKRALTAAHGGQENRRTRTYNTEDSGPTWMVAGYDPGAEAVMLEICLTKDRAAGSEEEVL